MPKSQARLIQKKEIARDTFLCALHMPECPFVDTIFSGCVFSWLVAEKTYRSYSLMYALNLDDAPSSLESMKQIYPPFTDYALKQYESGVVLYFLIAAKGQGFGAQYARSIHRGDIIQIVGPSGKFKLHLETYKAEKHTRKPRSIVFVGTGTGLAPSIGMAWDLYSHSLLEIFDIKAGVNGYDGDWVGQLLPPHTHYEICYTPKKNLSLNPHERNGLVTDAVLIDAEYHYYLCGHPKMVESVESLLLESEHTPQIYKENFAK